MAEHDDARPEPGGDAGDREDAAAREYAANEATVRGDENTVPFTATGDRTAWDSGRNSSVAEGSAETEAPGVARPGEGHDSGA